jgi:hypothetical protein
LLLLLAPADRERSLLELLLLLAPANRERSLLELLLLLAPADRERSLLELLLLPVPNVSQTIFHVFHVVGPYRHLREHGGLLLNRHGAGLHFGQCGRDFALHRGYDILQCHGGCRARRTPVPMVIGGEGVCSRWRVNS